MEKIYKAFYQADEIKGGQYGEGFYSAMLKSFESGKLSENEAVLVVDTLVEIDEIRDVFAGEIQQLIFQQIESGSSISEVCQFLKETCNFYNGEYIEEDVITKIFEDVLANSISLQDAVKKMNAIFA